MYGVLCVVLECLCSILMHAVVMCIRCKGTGHFSEALVTLATSVGRILYTGHYSYRQAYRGLPLELCGTIDTYTNT